MGRKIGAPIVSGNSCVRKGAPMRTYFNYNQYRESSAPIMASVVLFSESTVFWSPSFVLMQRYYDRGLSGISPAGFVDLLERGFVRVASREDWIENGPRRRATAEKWDGAKFTSFDSMVRQYFLDDQSKEQSTRRVFAIPEERGFSVADQLIDSHDHRAEIARYYVERNVIPRGTRSQLKDAGTNPSAPDVQLATRFLLRDAINHKDAVEAVGALIAIGPDAETESILRHVGEWQIPAALEPRASIENENLEAAIDFAATCGGRENDRDILLLMENARERRDIIELMSSTRPLPETLLGQIERALPVGGLDAMIGTSPFDKGLAIVEFGALVYAAYETTARKGTMLSRRAVLALPFLIDLAGQRGPATQALEEANVMPEADYNGPRWPFLLTFGDVNPTREQLIALSSALRHASL